MENIHKNCSFYLPVDAFKGLCKRTKEPLAADDAGCDAYDALPQCRHCNHFTSDAEFTGRCMNVSMAYPDMNATNCADFSWKKT
jgi:4-hydroxyphenylacetate decarboxylase small subunit